MSRFKNEVAHLQAHVKTLRLAGAALFVVALLLGFGWWSAPKSLTIHVPPDLRSGSTRKWWDVPPESVYAFTFYIWQQAQRWPTNGEQDYPRNLHALSAYFTPSCRAFLQQDYEFRRSNGELRQRARHLRDSRPRLRRRSRRARARRVGERLDRHAGRERRRVPGRRAGQARARALRAEGRAWTSIPSAIPSASCWTAMHVRPSASKPLPPPAPAGKSASPGANLQETPHEALLPSGPGRRPVVPGFRARGPCR